jgi:hypothetical protein
MTTYMFRSADVGFSENSAESRGVLCGPVFVLFTAELAEKCP